MAKMSGDFDKSMLKSPLTVQKKGQEPGPGVNNIPVAQPPDPLGYMPKKGK